MTREVYDLLSALCGMWSQYCGDKWGHQCMSAGEEAEIVLDDYELLIHIGSGYEAKVDWDKLSELEKTISHE